MIDLVRRKCIKNYDGMKAVKKQQIFVYFSANLNVKRTL
jgi:hypothetical protein